jgi:hypothetical protein
MLPAIAFACAGLVAAACAETDVGYVVPGGGGRPRSGSSGGENRGMLFAGHGHEADGRHREPSVRRMLQHTTGGGALDLNVCHEEDPPTAGAVTNSVGTVHDDAASSRPGDQIDCTLQLCSCGASNAQGGDCENGYGDNLDCGKTIQAPKGQTVSLVFTQMNLEDGGGSFGCTCGEGGCDYVEVFDGVDVHAPLLGHFTGTALPPRLSSTGTSLTIRFVTDHGNCGISGAEDPVSVDTFSSFASLSVASPGHVRTEKPGTNRESITL